jgi:hypothetical protein
MYLNDYPSDVPAARVYGTAAHDRARMAKVASPMPLRRVAVDKDNQNVPTDLLKHYADVRARLNPGMPRHPQNPVVSREYIVVPEPVVVKCKRTIRDPETVVDVSEAIHDCHLPTERDWLIITRPLTRKEVLAAASAYMGLTPSQAVSRCNRASFVRARHLAGYVMKMHTQSSFPQIAMRLGGRDHSSIVHGFQKVEALVAAGDESWIADIEAIKAALGVTE